MKKLLLSLSIASLGTTSFLPTMGMSPVANVKSDHDKNNLQKEALFDLETYNNQINNKFQQKGINLNKNIEGIIFDSISQDKVKRIYVDSSGDDKIPNFNKKYDKVQAKATNEKWYYKQFEIVSINVLDYAKSKKEFLQLIKYAEVYTQIGYNFWVSGPKDWEFSGGKNFDLQEHNFKIELNGEDHYTTVFEQNDSKHKEREYVKIEIKEDWLGNNLRIYARLGAMVKWSWASIYDHASILGMTNESVKFFEKEKLRNLESVENNLNILEKYSIAFEPKNSNLYVL